VQHAAKSFAFVETPNSHDRFDDCSPNTHREHTLTATGDLGEMQDLVSHTRVPMISKALIEREC
jgi:hypothetical protein